MYQNLDLFQTAVAMARHAGARQAVVAANIANADTPGYQARSIASFTESYRSDAAAALRATRPGHRQSGVFESAPAPQVSGEEPSPNGNSVSLEMEMLNAVEIQREHSRALAIYKHALGVIRTSLGR